MGPLCCLRFVDEYRRILASAQPDLDFRVIADSGHWTPYEAAEQVNAALCDMLGVNRRPAR